ncbi:MAG: Na+/H+ antiporter subunit E, partial [archaeon]|nr:Na+/H+ antiporter subunit E [archaeon]
MGKFLRQAGIFLLLYALWILFTCNLDFYELAAGFVVSAAVTYIFSTYIDLSVAECVFNPLKMLNLVVYMSVFLLNEIKSHLSVAKSIITGKIDPAIVKIVPDFETSLGRAFLANSITLTPGTVSVSIDKNLNVHCLNYDRNEKVGAGFTKYGRK